MSLTDHADVDLEESQQSCHGRHPGSSEVASKKKSLHDPLDMYIIPYLDHRGLRGGRRRSVSYWRIEVLSEPYDLAPTNPFDGPEPSLEVKEGLSVEKYVLKSII